MPSISGRRLHTWAFMLVSLTRAAQFAHLSRRIIERGLSELYKDKARWEDTLKDGYIKEAVPSVLVKLYRAGGPMYFDAEGTIDYFRHQYGYLCPLCFQVHFYSYSRFELTSFISPQFLRVEGEKYPTSSICNNCGDCMSRHFKFQPIETEEDCMSCLCVLFAKESFRKRLRDNRYRRIRFDPRLIFPVHGPLRQLDEVRPKEKKPAPVFKEIRELPPTPKAHRSETHKTRVKLKPRIRMWDALEDQQRRE